MKTALLPTSLAPWRLGGSIISALALSAAPFASAAELDFYRDVYPFLKANCVTCHNKTTTKAGLNMETPELMSKGGDSGPALVPGKGAESLVITAAKHLDDMEMPPPANKSGAKNLSAAQIATFKLWIDQGAKASVPQEHTVVWQPLAPGVDPIYSVALTRDGRFAVCGRANQIFVYDLATRQLAGQITDPAEKPGTAHRGLVQSLAFSPDGTRLASGSFREVKIWRLENAPVSAGTRTVAQPASEELLKKLTAASKPAITSSAMSADGKQVATGCADGSVCVWDAASLKPVAELRGNVTSTKKAAELEWSIAAQTLEQSFQKSEIARLEAQNKALDELLKKANDAIAAMKTVLPEKQKAVPPATEAKIAAQKALDEVQALIAKAPTAELTKQLKEAKDKLITAEITERSALAAVSAAESNAHDADADVKRITGSKEQNAKAIAAANAAVDAAAKLQAKATADLAALKQSLTKAALKPITVSFSADAQRVAAVFEDNALVVWAVASGTPIEQSSASAPAAMTLATAPDGSFIASKSFTVSAGAAPHWVLERKLDGKGLFADRVNAVRFSPDGKTLATGGGELSRSGDIILFDVASGKVTQRWNERHADSVLCLDFSPDGKLLASGAADKIARVTEVATGRQTNLFEGHTHHVTGIAFRADGRVLATAGAEGVVNTWDMIVSERKKKIEGWTKEVTSLEFIGATAQIVTSAGDNRVRIVTDDGAEVRAISKLPDYVQAAASTPSGSTIIGGGEDSQLRMWDGAGKELAVFGTK